MISYNHNSIYNHNTHIIHNININVHIAHIMYIYIYCDMICTHVHHAHVQICGIYTCT